MVQKFQGASSLTDLLPLPSFLERLALKEIDSFDIEGKENK